MWLRSKSLIFYIAKIILSLSICFLISHFILRKMDYAWSLISVVLVLSAEGDDVMELAFTRFKGNVVGAIVGIILLFLEIPNPYNILTGSVISLIICDRLKLMTGARSTLAAMIIILFHKEGMHLWDASLSRIFAVAIGSFTAISVTYFFHSVFKLKTDNVSDESKEIES